jgi:uncharacterized protein YsxB (DUF464 family)
MINVTITPTSLSVKGHAGYNPGNDIVCAAVSALVQTFEQSARDLTTDTITSSMEDGDAVITWPRAPTKELTILIDSAFLGLSSIADTFPQYVSVTSTR